MDRNGGYPDEMTPVERAWDEMLVQARDFDTDMIGEDTWPPPILTPLVRAVASSRLRRFFPYTSHAVLRFATRADFWRDEAPQPPVSIGLVPEPDEYVLWWGQLLSSVERATMLLMTADPVEAVALAELLLDAWPYDYPIRRRATAPTDLFWVTLDELASSLGSNSSRPLQARNQTDFE
jgi:hypothetical protein